MKKRHYCIPDYKYVLIESKDYYEGDLLISIQTQRAVPSTPQDKARWKRKGLI